MPADFQAPFLDTELWAPVLSHPGWRDPEHTSPQDHPFWDVFARLKPGVSISAAQSEVDSLWQPLRSALPEFHTGAVKVVPLREHFTGNVRKQLFILFAAVAALLFIACANVANLLLSKAALRQREIAVRAALGAGTVRLLQQLVTESLTLALLAGIVGTLAAVLFIPALKAFAPASTPLLDNVALNARALVFALVVVVVTGISLGLAPASRLCRLALRDSLTAANRGVTDSRPTRTLKDVLVACEFALAMILLTGAVLLIRSFVAVLNIDTGFHPDHVLTVQLNVPLPPPQRTQFYRDVLRGIAALPGVRSVGGAGNLFYLDETRNHSLRLVEGHSPEPESTWKPLVRNQVAGDYFQTVGIPLLRGRFFTQSDTPESAPVVIVNETLAHRYWPRQDPIGKRVKGFDPRGRHDDRLTVVGVVADTRIGGLEKAPFSQICEPQAQRTGEQIGSIVLRTSSDNLVGLSDAVRHEIHSVNRNAVISSVATLESLLNRQETSRRFQT